MASSIATTPTSVAKTTPTSSSYLPSYHSYHSHSHPNLSFRFSHSPNLRFFTKGVRSSWIRSSAIKGQLKEVRFFQWFSLEDLFSNFHGFVENLLEPYVAFKVPIGGSSDAATPAKSQVPAAETEDVKPSSEHSPAELASEESISEFISQVTSLVKLVDSRDIVELQLKQLDCELIIRKKEAFPQPTSSGPVFMMHSPPSSAAAPPAFQGPPHKAAPVPSSPAPSSSPMPLPSPPAAKPAKSSLPPLKCPMAGTFYRSPSPGEPPFVKVGDKVQKGQTLCIIEAMKLLNEIEADQSGTIVEILAEDGKPVSVDTPLFIIEP